MHRGELIKIENGELKVESEREKAESRKAEGRKEEGRREEVES
jgi:hypothetical protein